MSLDGKLLAKAKQALEARRRRNEAEFVRRQLQVYEKSPEVKAIDIDIRTGMLGVISAALSGDGRAEEKVARIGEDNLYLQEKRRQALVRAGFPADYLDEKPLCEKCGDSGFIGTEPCSCLMELYRKVQAKELSSLFGIGDRRFENFSLHWYDDTRDPATGTSTREHMHAVFTACKKYADSFGDKSGNLLLTGAPGLGKTFLSACIAGTVSEKGFSVVYAEAGKLFSDFEAAHFSKGDDADAAKAEVRRYTLCDLLIFDDLGTEMTTAFTVSALYELINTRLNAGKKTVINTNLSVSDISARYSPQIASRLAGEYQVLPFFGKDIRILKKNSK